mmetsp:Transcript_89766/g.205192  ORF Transcript_89766/g.205192 Transcript_89766/m.205192 type:complete len:222 (+) Transcript_89766:225-890(+)
MLVVEVAPTEGVGAWLWNWLFWAGLLGRGLFVGACPSRGQARREQVPLLRRLHPLASLRIVMPPGAGRGVGGPWSRARAPQPRGLGRGWHDGSRGGPWRGPHLGLYPGLHRSHSQSQSPRGPERCVRRQQRLGRRRAVPRRAPGPPRSIRGDKDIHSLEIQRGVALRVPHTSRRSAPPSSTHRRPMCISQSQPLGADVEQTIGNPVWALPELLGRVGDLQR